jgi:hypothetical protein
MANGILHLAPRLREIATATGSLPAHLVERYHELLEQTNRYYRRQQALQTCQQYFDPDSQQSRWQTALQIQDGIKRLDRIRPGRLLTPLESALREISDGASSAVKIHKELPKVLTKHG